MGDDKPAKREETVSFAYLEELLEAELASCGYKLSRICGGTNRGHVFQLSLVAVPVDLTDEEKRYLERNPHMLKVAG